MKERILVLLLIIAFSYPTLSYSNNQKVNIEENTVVDTFIVCGNCYTCKLRIQGELANLTGILAANWSTEEVLEISYDPTQIVPVQFLQSIADVGHDTEKVRATDEAYAKLVGTCCEYDRWLTYEQLNGDWQVEGKLECKRTIEDVLLGLHGITEGSWDDGIINASFYKQITEPDIILKNLANAGFDNETYTSTDEAYEMLSDACKYRSSDTTETDSTLSILNQNLNTLSIYPNPVYETINIDEIYKKVQSVHIISTEGKIIVNITPSQINLNQGINVDYLQKGIYIFQINTLDNSYSSKFIKN